MPNSGIDWLPVFGLDRNQLRRRIAREPSQANESFIRCACHHCGLGDPTRMDCPGPVDLEKVLARQRSPTDWNPRAVGIDNQLLSGEAIVSLWPADLECAGAIHRQAFGYLRAEAAEFTRLSVVI